MKRILKNDWHDIVGDEFQKDYYLKLRRFLIEEYRNYTVYPNPYDLFNAFHYTPYEKTKVVILGQDPYHGPNQAHGLSFSVKKGVTPPPSLQNIFKELSDDLGYRPPKHGYLLPWAKQGVLLLNTVLSVRRGMAGSHRGKGWEQFTDAVIRSLNDRDRPVIFVLWGRQAQAKKALITNEHHYVLEAAHPSPFSAHRGFFGSRPFSTINRILEKEGMEPIDWRLE